MAKVTSSADLQNCPDFEIFKRMVVICLGDIVDQINGNITLQDNVTTSGPLTAIFPIVDTQIAVTHQLGATPSGYIIVNKSAAMDIYKSPGTGPGFDWTNTTIYLNSTGVGTAVIYVV